jgi:hypothetical protein
MGHSRPVEVLQELGRTIGRTSVAGSQIGCPAPARPSAVLEARERPDDFASLGDPYTRRLCGGGSLLWPNSHFCGCLDVLSFATGKQPTGVAVLNMIECNLLAAYGIGKCTSIPRVSTLINSSIDCVAVAPRACASPNIHSGEYGCPDRSRSDRRISNLVQ